MLDCASWYRNEDKVGEVITDLMNEKVVTREELFIVSKVWWDEIEDCEAACKRSLANLKCDYIDLYLIHWPIALNEHKVEGQPSTYTKKYFPMHKIWPQMEALVEKGLVRSIGISNFGV